MAKLPKFCPNCGNKLLGTEKFCGKCGYDVSSITQEKDSEKIPNEQEKPEVNESDENRPEEEQKDKSSVPTKLAQEQEKQSKVDITSSADKKEKLISKIVWTIGIVIALIGVGAWGVYMINQHSHPETSSKIDKSQSKKPKKNSQKPKATKGKVYTTKINKITVGGRREGTDWVIEGTTKAPDNSMMIAILPKKNTVDLSGAAYVSNIAYNTTDDEGGGIAEVHDGRFQIEITPDSSAYYNKNGDKEAVKDNQDIKVKIVAIANFNMKIEDMSSPLPQKLVSEVNRKGKITILTTNHKQGEYYRNWGDDSDESSSEESTETSDSEDVSSSQESSETGQSSQAQADSQSSSVATKTNVVNSPEEAVALAKATFGDNNGDWVWGDMSGSDRDPEVDGYFVKAISKSSTTMTKTAKSVLVFPDGTIKEDW